MGAVDLLDNAVSTNWPQIKSKKRWYSHIVNTICVFVGAACKIHRSCNPKDDQYLLYFVCHIARSYLHSDALVQAHQYWKTETLIDASQRCTG